MASFPVLLSEIRGCTLCAAHLPHGVRPVVQASPSARLLIVGQAPGRKVHESGIPFDDASGDRLRAWMGIDREVFYDPKRVAIVPMGFCFPGTGKAGDFPPRPECAPAWREKLLGRLRRIELTLMIGQYAHAWHMESLGREARSLTENVRAWKEFLPGVLPLPHPSPRNRLWLKQNPWFEETVVPELRRRVRELLPAA